VFASCVMRVRDGPSAAWWEFGRAATAWLFRKNVVWFVFGKRISWQNRLLAKEMKIYFSLFFWSNGLICFSVRLMILWLINRLKLICCERKTLYHD
jgi:hypothetical protein